MGSEDRAPFPGDARRQAADLVEVRRGRRGHPHISQGHRVESHPTHSRDQRRRQGLVLLKTS